MKRTIIVAALLGLFAIPAAVAQENATTDYLPKSGDFSFGVDLTPLINFMGNIFNSTDNQTLDDIGGEPISVVSAQYAITQPSVSLVGRYMLTNSLAVRANVGVLINTSNSNVYVADDAASALDPLSTLKVVDGVKSSERGASVAASIEKRLGRRRIQGVVSAGLVYGFATSSTKYTYGNAITEINQVPTTDSGLYEYVSDAMPNARITNDFLSDGSHAYGLISSVGVEWFVAPKVSIGAEVNLVAVHSFTTGQAAQYEGYNTYMNSVTTHTELVAPRASSFTFGTENVGGNLAMHFYF